MIIQVASVHIFTSNIVSVQIFRDATCIIIPVGPTLLVCAFFFCTSIPTYVIFTLDVIHRLGVAALRRDCMEINGI